MGSTSVQVPLPPAEIRPGERRRRVDDHFFVETAARDVRLLTAAGLRPGQRVLDFGSGPGRLAIGLISSGWRGSYLGVEVNQRHVRWATDHISPRFGDFRFELVDAENHRYNPDGMAERRLPAHDSTVDVVCAFSVFTHMLGGDVTAYLAEFRRVLKPDGMAYVTVFVDDDAPAETENPAWVGNWNGRLHYVLYATDHLTDLIGRSGFEVAGTDDLAEGKAGLVLRPDPGPRPEGTPG